MSFPPSEAPGPNPVGPQPSLPGPGSGGFPPL